MSDAVYSTAYLTTEQKEEIELLEMKACLTLLDEQIVQLRLIRDRAASATRQLRSDEYETVILSAAHSTALARRLNARANETLLKQTLSEQTSLAPVRVN